MYGYGKGVELVLIPVDENRLLLERVPKLSELFGLLGDVEASKVLMIWRGSMKFMLRGRGERGLVINGGNWFSTLDPSSYLRMKEARTLQDN